MSAEPSRPYADDCAKVYTPSGRVAHLRPPDYSITGAKPVLCPQSLPWGGWLGTGSQAEYDRAAALPACKACIRVAGQLDAEKRL